jgi:hypothetical protein
MSKPAATRGGTRKPKDPTEPREYNTWWKLEQRFGDCDNPNCLDDRPHRVQEGNTMVALVKEKSICRICFLDGWLSNG